MIGEPEAAVRIEHDVVRTAQRHAMIARLVQYLDFAGIDIDALDPPGRIIVGDTGRRAIAVCFGIVEPAVVAAIELADGSDCTVVWTSARRRYDTLLASVPTTPDC